LTEFWSRTSQSFGKSNNTTFVDSATDQFDADAAKLECDLARLLRDAEFELRSTKLSDQEMQLRLKIVQSVATVKAMPSKTFGIP
jgi:hypothetical protein